MNTRSRSSRFGVLFLVLMILVVWFYTRTSALRTDDSHAHDTGNHAVIASFAQHRYHAEMLVEEGGLLRIYIRGQDASRVVEVPMQILTAYVNAQGGEAVPLSLSASPQPGDGNGRTSQFVGQLPWGSRRRSFTVMIPNLNMGNERFALGLDWSGTSHDGMPDKVTDESERALYFEPGGKYSTGDINANGSQLPSEKFAGFRAQHDFSPKPGDRICPITRTKANPECAWVIDGRRYEFCCPPCIDEFVTIAKERPDDLLAPDAYRP